MKDDNLEQYRKYMIDPLDKNPALSNYKRKKKKQKSKIISKEPKKRMSEIFIGKNYQKIKTRKFSFAGFFFRGSYYLYRKMYLKGIILLLITYFLCLITPIILLLEGYQNYIFIPYIILFIFSIIIGFTTNKTYKHFVIKKMNKIRNQNLSYDESAVKCKTIGRTSFINMIIINIFILLLFIIVINYAFINELTDLIETMNPIILNI